MAGSTNFLPFNPNKNNMVDDATYLSSGYRLNGAVSGIAPSNQHNKLYYQSSTMCAALAKSLSDKGFTVMDDNFNNLVAVLSKIATTDQIPTTPAEVGAVNKNGDNMLGDLTLDNNRALRTKDTIGVARWLAGISSDDIIYLGDKNINTVLQSKTAIEATIAGITKTIATMDLVAPAGLGIGGNVNAVNSVSIRSITKGGRYYCNGCTDVPVAGYNGYLDVMCYSDAYMVHRYTLYDGATFEIKMRNNIWDSEWKQISTMDLVVPTTKEAAGDWNDYITTGTFFGANLANAPIVGTTYWYWVEVIRYVDTYTYQRAHSFGASVGVSYERTQDSGVWSPWKKILTTNLAIDYVVAQQLGVNGYTRWASGKLEQWGVIANVSLTQTIQQPVTYPTPYPAGVTPNITGMILMPNYVQGAMGIYVVKTSVNNIGFTIGPDPSDSTSTGDISWRSVG